MMKDFHHRVSWYIGRAGHTRRLDRRKKSEPFFPFQKESSRFSNSITAPLRYYLPWLPSFFLYFTDYRFSPRCWAEMLSRGLPIRIIFWPPLPFVTKYRSTLTHSARWSPSMSYWFGKSSGIGALLLLLIIIRLLFLVHFRSLIN